MGRGQAMLLVGGMMCDQRLWQHQLPVLREHCDTVMIADLTRSSSIERMALDAIDIAPAEFALAGLSMGGIVAFELWRRVPERITHLALLDTNPAAESEERRQRRTLEIQVAKSGQLSELMIRDFKPNYLSESSRRDTRLLAEVLDMAVSLGVDVFERQSIALRDRPDSRDTLATITCPTAVICGRQDTLCPPETHQFMAASIRDAELTIIDDCGHLSPLERPQEVTAALLGLMRRH